MINNTNLYYKATVPGLKRFCKDPARSAAGRTDLDISILNLGYQYCLFVKQFYLKQRLIHTRRLQYTNTGTLIQTKFRLRYRGLVDSRTRGSDTAVNDWIKDTMVYS